MKRNSAAVSSASIKNFHTQQAGPFIDNCTAPSAPDE